MDWTHILAYVAGTVDQELLVRNKYLAAENRILKSQLNGRLRLSDAERAMLGRSVTAWAALRARLFQLLMRNAKTPRPRRVDSSARHSAGSRHRGGR
jgi:hypothetical protein